MSALSDEPSSRRARAPRGDEGVVIGWLRALGLRKPAAGPVSTVEVATAAWPQGLPGQPEPDED